MTTAYEKIDERLRRLPDWAVFAFGMIQALAIVAVKTIALPGVPLTDFLLIPVAWTGWLSRSRTYAYAAAVCIAGVTVFFAEVGPTRAPLAATLVSAAAGFGQTTLVAEWFADGPATAWLSPVIRATSMPML